ncbi:tyrosine aminotransferase [Syncephalis pseudoplumigaleata]|uniref:Tyrosine aminotransferase n=1 Tax=Syncephalis pseudoplumigaleata TaxID=1712513 RepID=A0A4V1J235_9FUNG|nr:tyrosine aminotransferase [Syncephalis pseudoplumigaleata]|eukprot:RKP27179.1 tyrosine aminotransferase [Syncephalis pseudoplumigaleata]
MTATNDNATVDAASAKTAWRPIHASVVSKRTVNPIRRIVDNLNVVPNAAKPVISLALGDPTVFGNLSTHRTSIEAMEEAMQKPQTHGYAPSIGFEVARAAIAAHHSTPEAPLTSGDVVIASGCSGALDLCITALANEGDEILVPQPGFSLYETLATSKGIGCQYYRLRPEQHWEADLEHMATLITPRTRAIVINNPSNPCGSVYTRAHLLDLLAFCERHQLPIIADEIYCDLVFSGHTFHPMATLTTSVPILAVGGLAKKYLVPGWRLGWILIHDRHQRLQEIRTALNSLSQLIIGANTVVQMALPKILADTPPSFHADTIRLLEKHAELSATCLSGIPGLTVVVPQGAMYMMVGIKPEAFADIPNDLVFTERLMAEESVFCLPGQCFGYPNYFRIVYTAPEDKLREAYDRIRAFVERHRSKC